MLQFLVPAAIVLLLVVPNLIFKRAKLKFITLRANETVLSEEYPVSVEMMSKFSSRGSNFYPNCLVRITNQRVIIAQKTIFAKPNPDNYGIRAIFIYAGPEEAPTGLAGGTFKIGYGIWRLDSESLTVQTEAGDSYLQITLPITMDLVTPRWFKIYAEQAGKWGEILRKQK